MRRAGALKLYWLESPDHHEDWFVVARTARSARAFFEEAEGYGRGDATSRLVVHLPKELQSDAGSSRTTPEVGAATAPCWPSEEVIKACGGVYLMDGDTRVVKLGGRTYAEGMLEAEIRERQRALSSDDPDQ